MAEKRKRAESIEDDESNYAKKWALYRENAGKALKERLAPQKKPATKAKHANFITTRLVEYDGKKKRYNTMEEKQCVEIMSTLEFDTVSDRIWEYYGTKLGYTKTDYVLNVITGLNGPIVRNTAQLDNKKDLFVLFEKTNEFHSISSIPSTNPYRTWSGTYRETNQTVDNFAIPKSVFPRITPSAIMLAARVVETECIVETGIVKRFIRNANGWAWMPGFEIKFVKGDLLSSGSFRDAYHARIIDYGELPKTEYVLKFWNEEAIEGRQSEGGDGRSMAISDLTKRAVQCQMVAKGLCEAMAPSVDDSYGETFTYVMSYYIETKDSILSLEPKIHGKFVKYLNNTMDRILVLDDFGLKAASLAHFSLFYTKGESLLTDLQGAGYDLTDPEMATISRYNKTDNTLNFGFGNMGADSIESFKSHHECNRFCTLAGLGPIIN